MTNERTNSYYRDRRMDLLGIRGGMNMECRECERYGLDEDIEHKMVIDLRECSIELLDELCFQTGVETGTKEEMIARLLE